MVSDDNKHVAVVAGWPGWLAGWLVGWLAGWLTGWLADWLAGAWK
jgi:hypothetical protein